MKKSALIVKEDGLIYVNEVPEENEFYRQDSARLPNSKTFFMVEYTKALTSAKESAILVSDQEQATGLIYMNASRDNFQHRGNYVVGIKPGIYPIPDLKWEVKEGGYLMNGILHSVAIINPIKDMNYERCILEVLSGSTPREKYETLKALHGVLEKICTPRRGTEEEKWDIQRASDELTPYMIKEFPF